MLLQIIFALFISFSALANTNRERISHEKINEIIGQLNEINDDTLIQILCDTATGAFKSKKKFKKTLHPDFYKFGANCSKFIMSDGEYGSWGLVISKYLNEEPGAEVFFQDELFDEKNIDLNACPNWKSLDKKEREHFWVWVMAAIAYKESACKEKIKGESIHVGQHAMGLLQLDSHSDNLTWRGENCKAKTILTPETNLRCGLDIMEELMKGKEGLYRSSGALWGRKSNSFWAELRKKNGGKIAKLIRTHPLCFNHK